MNNFMCDISVNYFRDMRYVMSIMPTNQTYLNFGNDIKWAKLEKIYDYRILANVNSYLIY